MYSCGGQNSRSTNAGRTTELAGRVPLILETLEFLPSSALLPGACERRPASSFDPSKHSNQIATIMTSSVSPMAVCQIQTCWQVNPGFAFAPRSRERSISGKPPIVHLRGSGFARLENMFFSEGGRHHRPGRTHCLSRVSYGEARLRA